MPKNNHFENFTTSAAPGNSYYQQQELSHFLIPAFLFTPQTVFCSTLCGSSGSPASLCLFMRIGGSRDEKESRDPESLWWSARKVNEVFMLVELCYPRFRDSREFQAWLCKAAPYNLSSQSELTTTPYRSPWVLWIELWNFWILGPQSFCLWRSNREFLNCSSFSEKSTKSTFEFFPSASDLCLFLRLSYCDKGQDTTLAWFHSVRSWKVGVDFRKREIEQHSDGSQKKYVQSANLFTSLTQ